MARHYQKYYQQSITELELQGVSNPEDLDKYQRSRILCEKEYPRYKKTADQLGQSCHSYCETSDFKEEQVNEY